MQCPMSMENERKNIEWEKEVWFILVGCVLFTVDDKMQNAAPILSAANANSAANLISLFIGSIVKILPMYTTRLMWTVQFEPSFFEGLLINNGTT